MSNKNNHTKIKTKKRGNKLGFWIFKISIQIFGLCGAYGLLYIVCLYYLFFDKQAVLNASPYIEKRFPDANLFYRYLHLYRLFISQGKQLIDRYAFISDNKLFDLTLHGYEQFISLVNNPQQGMILLTAHVGNWQIAMTALNQLKKTVYLLMRPEDNAAVQATLHINQEQERIKFISPEQYLGGIVEIMNVLKQGQIISIMGDRKYGFEAIEVSFLGQKAWFPYSAFHIAATTGCPIVILLSAKTGTKEYIVDVSHILYPQYKGRQNKAMQLQALVQEFVTILEDFIKKYPYQCFLFHNVWQDKEK